MNSSELPTLSTLDELAEAVRRSDGGRDLYVRWSKGPADDRGSVSRDDLTDAPLQGLSANPLLVPEWWGDRPLRLWVARRLHDYRHLRQRRGAKPWLLEGDERGRGPDNEPLVECRRALAWIADDARAEADEVVGSQHDWGPLDRTANAETKN